VAAIEEEKLSRIRHVGMNYAGGLPERAVEFCLRSARITLADIDYVAYYLEPEKLFNREIAFHSSRALHVPITGSVESFPNYFVESLNGLRRRAATRQQVESQLSEKGRFVTVNHHLAHGASAFYASSFEHAAVISVGNRGDMNSTALMIGENARLHVIDEAAFPDSVGMVYSAVAAALGFNAQTDLHRVMWLAPTGKAEMKSLFSDLLSVDSEGLPRVNLDYFNPSFAPSPSLSEKFFEGAGVGPRSKDQEITDRHRNLAASLQAHTEDVLVEMAVRLRQQTGEEHLCLAGGVALNSFANAAIEKRAGFKQLFVQPAAGNAGCSLGAALSVWHQTLGNGERVWQMKHAFLGPSFDDHDIKSVLDNCKISYEYLPTEDKLVAEVARELAAGRIVGWYRGAMEFGPRALGARSILATPTSEMMRENLNLYIKHREDFRPFSASVPEEQKHEFFETGNLTEFLQSVSKVRENKRHLMPAAIFGDGLVRVHSVARKTNPTLWKLLVKFGEATGVPVLLNTSFNLFGEPVVSTPREAVRGFYCSGIDCLAIGNFLVKK
jgi:carbamoyltransferase